MVDFGDVSLVGPRDGLHLPMLEMGKLSGSFPVFSLFSFAASILNKGLCKEFTRPILQGYLIGL